MSGSAKATTATVIPGLRYANAAMAIDWLCRAFGFEKRMVVPGDDGTIVHAQLTFGNGMIMLSSARADEYGRLLKQPADLGGAETQVPYIIVDDADAHYARAKAAGAMIVSEPEDQSYGGRLYTCRDIEGRLWNFGTYDPWEPV